MCTYTDAHAHTTNGTATATVTANVITTGTDTGTGLERTNINGVVPYEGQEIVFIEQVFERFPFAFHAKAKMLQSLAEKERAKPASTSPPSKTLLNLGMPKAGRYSLHILICARYNSCHYVNNKVKEPLSFKRHSPPQPSAWSTV
jgi:hypothetical protein